METVPMAPERFAPFVNGSVMTAAVVLREGQLVKHEACEFAGAQIAMICDQQNERHVIPLPVLR